MVSGNDSIALAPLCFINLDDVFRIGEGNPWAQQWGNIADLTVPYPDASSVDVTAALNDQVRLES